MYVNNIENISFFLVRPFFALHGVYAAFGPRSVKKLTKKSPNASTAPCDNSTFTISFTEMFMWFEKHYSCFDLHKPFSCDKQQIANDCWNMFRLL